MKIKFTLDRDDVKNAIAAHVNQQSGIACHASHVHFPVYSWDDIYVEIDAEQELASVAAEQELERALAIKEAA